MPKFKNGLARVGKVYHYCFTIERRQFKGSTRAQDRATAEKVLAQKRKDALLGPESQPQPIPTLGTLADAWVESYQRSLSKRHVEIVGSCAKVWLKPELGDVRLDRISTQRVLDLRQKVLAAGRSPSTANLLLRTLNLLMSYAIRIGHLERKPYTVSLLKVQRKPRPTIPAESVATFIDGAAKISRNPQVGVMLATLIGCGLRASEVLAMRWVWLDPTKRTYTVGVSKGKEARVIPIPDWLWLRLVGMPRTLSPYVFPSKDGGLHHRHFLRQPLQRLCRELGLGNVTVHRLRGSFATLHAEAGTPITAIQSMLGHADIKTTLIYIEQGFEVRRRSQDALAKQLGLA